MGGNCPSSISIAPPPTFSKLNISIENFNSKMVIIRNYPKFRKYIVKDWMHCRHPPLRTRSSKSKTSYSALVQTKLSN